MDLSLLLGIEEGNISLVRQGKKLGELPRGKRVPLVMEIKQVLRELSM
ncbi:hypothetical protein HS7_12630 [Sulfolobales archaeon HS-7]|nr:hypothetical protein HS7_12630 [Sulfolobales archaeon HS-7]